MENGKNGFPKCLCRGYYETLCKDVKEHAKHEHDEDIITNWLIPQNVDFVDVLALRSIMDLINLF